MSERPEAVDLSVRVGRLHLRTPIVAASGCFGYGLEYQGVVDYDALGGVVTKGLSLVPRPGNPPPRIVETPAGMLNAIGLENIGVDAFLEQKLPAFDAGVDSALVLVANLFGTAPEDYARLAERCEAHPRIAALELNISCPNVKAGGVELGRSPRAAAEVTALARSATERPLWVKLSPNAGDAIVEVAQAVAEAGADALCVINTLSGMVIDVERRRPVLANVTGGLSGPALRPVALRMVHQVSSAVVGIGGIASAEDVVAFLLAGASAVQVGTALFAGPDVPAQIVRDLRAYALRHGLPRIADLTGALET